MPAKLEFCLLDSEIFLGAIMLASYDRLQRISSTLCLSARCILFFVKQWS